MMIDRPAGIEISVVSPVYQAEPIVDELVRQLSEAVAPICNAFEIVLVDDRSTDGSWRKIAENCARYPFVKGIRLSRNCGQHIAITAGLANASGDYVVVVDCDLQDSPRYIPQMLEKMKEGNDVVFTFKSKRHHSLFKNVTSRLFHMTFNYLSETGEPKSSMEVGSYSMLSRKAVDAYVSIREFHRHYLMVLRLVGMNQAYVEIDHEKRFAGNSSYTVAKLIRLAVTGITSHSVRLLHVSIALGFALCGTSTLWAFYLIVNYIRHGALSGYTSQMVMLLLSTGLILMSIGIAGIYIGKIFEQVKDRPLYIVDQRLNGPFHD